MSGGAPGGRASARERLGALDEALRRSGVRTEFTGIGVGELTVERRVKVACHARPWNGPLFFCVPCPGGPCRALGRAEQVTEVAGVVLRMVRTKADGADTSPGTAGGL
ncbi:hypothetical protein [Actinomadura roseirufa]|uniref:hypothetical protein n=1 Tax=Actinomadura roseirufa TaxID=2094049 RepID=UPI00104125F5|nr:hypothetical protein [Actinomadura roseirufa]